MPSFLAWPFNAAVFVLLQDQALQRDTLEELDAEEEPGGRQCREGGLFSTPHVSPPRSSPQEQPPPAPRHSFASDSSEEEDRQRPEGSGGPSPLHVLEDLAPEEAYGQLAEGGEAAGPEQEPPAEGADQPAPRLPSPPAGLNGDGQTGQGDGGARRELTLSRDDRLLIEKIKSYYEGVEAVQQVPRKDGPPGVPAGVVRESILHFNSILRQNHAQAWDGGGARARPLHPPTPGCGSSGRGHSQSCTNGAEEGWGQPHVGPEHSGRGRSHSDGPRSPGSCPDQACCDGPRKGRGQPGSAQSNAVQDKPGQEPSPPGPKRGSLEEEPREPEFKSCAEIRRAWQEKERSAIGAPRKGGQGAARGSSAPPEAPPYAEPLHIVEDSDLEDSPSAHSRGPEGAARGAEAEERQDPPAAQGPPGYLPSLDLYESSGDPSLLENSERILSKVQALAQMYSEKISRLRAPRRGPPRKTPSRSLPGTQEGSKAASAPHCE